MKSRARTLAASLALAFAGLLLLLGLLELGMRLAGYVPIHSVYSAPSLLWKRDELLGWSHEPNRVETYVGPRPFPIEYEVEVRTNSLGLRGPEIEDLPPGGYRVLVLGDSYVAGFEVEEHETFSAVAEVEASRRLGIPLQVINAGVRGYGTDQNLLYYSERGHLLHPDLVVLFYSANDPDDNVTLHRMRRPFGKAAYVPRADGSFELVGHPIPEYPPCTARRLDASYEVRDLHTPVTQSFCRAQMLLFDRSALFTFVSSRLTRARTLLEWLYDLGGARREEGVARIAPLLRTAGALLLPRSASAEPASAEADPVSFEYALTTDLVIELQRRVVQEGSEFVFYLAPWDLERLDRAHLEREGVELILTRKLGPLQDPRAYTFRNDGHPNAAGHRHLARPLVEFIEGRVRDRRS